MRFRPCIDLHEGKVKQIIGSTFSNVPGETRENFVSDKTPGYFAELYRSNGLKGGHVIQLGKKNEEAALEALAAYPGHLQLGGGVEESNSVFWLENGAEKIILTSYIINQGEIHMDRLQKLAEKITPGKITLDLSCAKEGSDYWVMSNQWRIKTRVRITKETLSELSRYCSEFLVHAVHLEGKKQGPDFDLVKTLSEISPIPLTYAGGIRSLEDLEEIGKQSQKKLDFTVGSALDIFGGQGLKYADLIRLYS